MSFSSEIKEELSKLSNLSNKQNIQAEFTGYLLSGNISVLDSKIKYSTESDYNINRFSKLLNNIKILNYKIEIHGKKFVITFDRNLINKFVKIDNQNIYITKDFKEEEIKALVRGAFLGGGSINNPESKYHLEIVFSNKFNADWIYNKMLDVDIHLKKLYGKNLYALYIKEGEEISKFLAFIGANNAVLKFEEIRVKRHMNNKVNRLVNCETANLNKTINASIEQIEAIKYLQDINYFNKLDKNLKQIAIIRLNNPNLTLLELGELANPKIGKSGVNYRLKKIIQIAEELKKEGNLSKLNNETK